MNENKTILLIPMSERPHKNKTGKYRCPVCSKKFVGVAIQKHKNDGCIYINPFARKNLEHLT